MSPPGSDNTPKSLSKPAGPGWYPCVICGRSGILASAHFEPWNQNYAFLISEIKSLRRAGGGCLAALT